MSNRSSRSACEILAEIVGGEIMQTSPACVVMRVREDLRPTILGRRTGSALVLPFGISVENNQNGRTLNLGESVVTQREANRLIRALQRRGLIVTALHNHWLFEEPRLMYIHWENIGNPFDFARDSMEAAREAGIFDDC